MSPPQAIAPASPASPSQSLARVAGLLAIALVSLIAYWPALHAGFVWDDAAHRTAAALQSWRGLGRIWTEPGATQQYYPLLHSLFWFEHRLWGDAAAGYHVANLALHIAAVWLLFTLLRRLAVPGAWLAALVFALHPVHVESVAWISEQKNTLSLVFYLGAALAYLRFDAKRRWSSYALGFALFIGALLSKSVTATLPAALLVVNWWRRGSLAWRTDVLPLLPWFAVGAGAGLFTAWAERHFIGAAGAAFELSFLQRLLLSGHVVWFYLGKLLWPQNLAFVYPRWEISASDPVRWLPLLAALAATAAAWLVRHRTRAPLAAWLFFVGSLFPVLGFLNVFPFQFSFVADHFQYLASIGPIALAAATAHRAIHAAKPARLATAAVVCGLVVSTRAQTHAFRDFETLFWTTLHRNPAAWMAYNNLAERWIKQPRTHDVAVQLFERALVVRPDYPEAHSNLGLALAQGGNPKEAIAHLEQAVRLKPNYHEAYNNLGIALVGDNRPAEAAEAFRHAAMLNPSVASIHENLAKTLRYLGHDREAQEEFALAQRLREAASADIR